MSRRAGVSLAIAALAGVALAWLAPDSYQQDAGHHFLAARWAWRYPQTLVGVWNRPLFTLLYSAPALFGYPAAKLFTLALALVTADQTRRLARDLGVARAWLAVALLFLQPAYFLIIADTMTEPLFALVFVVALRLDAAGRREWSALVASLLVTVRPEGFFLGLLWAFWMIGDRGAGARVGAPAPAGRRAIRTLLLATGGAAWWVAALALTGDPLFIRHNWPGNWGLDATYGVGPVWIYVARLPEIAGLLLLVPFLAGLGRSLRERRYPALTAPVLVLFVVHTVLRVTGWFGSAGYARYFVCVSPAIALLTLVGWNDFGARLLVARPTWRVRLGRLVLAASAVVCVLYADMAGFYGRDARAIADMTHWFDDHPRPVARFIWSQAYMDVLFDRDPSDHPQMYADHARNMEILRAFPPGTLVFWDADIGRAWYQLTADDIQRAGYVRLLARSYRLDGWLHEGRLFPWSIRSQQLFLFYKP